MASLAKKQSPDTIAYFSMEVGIDRNVPTYSGGLGILAGDTIRAAADLDLPYVAVTLLTRQGYFKQRIDAKGIQHTSPVAWDIKKHLKPCKPQVKVRLDGRSIKVRAWRYEARGIHGTIIPVLYLDTDITGNHQDDRQISQTLYGGDHAYRLRQEWILGTAGVKMLRALGYRQIKCFHMNEGHAAFLTFELLAEAMKKDKQSRLGKKQLELVRQQCVFTTHTPIPAGHDAFALKDAKQAIGKHPAWAVTKALGVKNGVLNMTCLALSLSRYVNGVAQKHGEVSRAMFPDYTIDAITNGVHVPSWTVKSIQKLLDQHVPDWRQDNSRLRYAINIPLKELWQVHQANKAKLIDKINRRSKIPFSPKAFTIGFARRATAYKRADLVLQRLDRLAAMAAKHGKIQIVFAGKSHPKDAQGQQLIKNITDAAQASGFKVPITYLSNYDMALAQTLIPGVDLWLNTPEPPLEASGTSGMKAAVNGVPSLSVLDGWWIEGCVEGLTGWAIDSPDKPAAQITAVLRKLEQVIKLYYQEPEQYRQIMRNALALNGAYFNTQRMVEEYVRKAYLL